MYFTLTDISATPKYHPFLPLDLQFNLSSGIFSFDHSVIHYFQRYFFFGFPSLLPLPYNQKYFTLTDRYICNFKITSFFTLGFTIQNKLGDFSFDHTVICYFKRYFFFGFLRSRIYFPS